MIQVQDGLQIVKIDLATSLDRSNPNQWVISLPSDDRYVIEGEELEEFKRFVG